MPAQITKHDENYHTSINPGKSRYIVEIKRDVCIGAASCVAIGAETFGLDDQNKVFFLEGAEWDSDDLILAAAQSCPVFAIIIKDAATGKQIFPEEQ